VFLVRQISLLPLFEAAGREKEKLCSTPPVADNSIVRNSYEEEEERRSTTFNKAFSEVHS
jgi:hypothetical protein